MKKRHSHINPDSLLDGINKLKNDYLKELDTQENECLKVESEDHLLSRIEKLLAGRVGSKPDKDAIKTIMDDGRARYKAFTPPGYKDAIKEKEVNNKYVYGGVSYERQFGDLIVWKQILQYVNNEDKTHLIFVTDDNKEDWWQISQGKTIGFRMELIDEIYSETKLQSFNAYSLGSFLASAQRYLKEGVSEEAIDEVNVVSEGVGVEALSISRKYLDAVAKEELTNKKYSSNLERALEHANHLAYPSAVEKALEHANHLAYPSAAVEKALEHANHLAYPSALERALENANHLAYPSAVEKALENANHLAYPSALERALENANHLAYPSAVEKALENANHLAYPSALERALEHANNYRSPSALENVERLLQSSTLMRAAEDAKRYPYHSIDELIDGGDLSSKVSDDDDSEI
ncbi:PIN-like domain-containing protein [Vibrio splendidus]